MTTEMKAIRRSLEDAVSFEQFKQNFLANIGCGHIERSPVNRASMIRKLLTEVGVQDHLTGYCYIECAVGLVLDDGEMIHDITNRLYPAIAEKFGSTPSRTERAIRHAIENACDNCDPNVLMRYFGNTISPTTGKPTNSQFIARMANIIRDRM